MTQSKPAPYDHIVFTEFDGTEGILVDLDTKKYYQLNETAMLIWKSLENGNSPAQIASTLAADYEITADDALRVTEQTVRKFEAYKLVGSK